MEATRSRFAVMGNVHKVNFFEVQQCSGSGWQREGGCFCKSKGVSRQRDALHVRALWSLCHVSVASLSPIQASEAAS